ncbi:Mu transposase C-terminal domain-containing protein [Algihabitans albus]|uniref:Mu transposase C-terminal domain-containing protein n=1 Tax=Algihabitans albus TaxID=2164067 RepID=UPI000E5C91A3|nr:Mu transposase C-terminal domain-containing protein [Algihabitans albus]
MKAWWSASELAAATLPGLPGTRRKVAERAERDGWTKRETVGNGGTTHEYHVASLPEAARVALALRAQAAPGEAELLAEAAETGGGQRGKAEAQAWAVQRCARLCREAGLSARAGRPAFVAAYGVGQLSAPDWVRAALPTISAKSLERWSAKAKAAGAAGLADRRGRHRKGAGRIDRDPEMVRLIEGLLSANPHASSKHVMRALRARYNGETPPYRTVQRWLQSWREAEIQLHAHVSDPDGHRSRLGSAMGAASAGISRVNQLWELDSTPTDVVLADGRRHAVLGVIDVYSRRMLFQVARTSTAAAVLALLRRAILEWGVPEIVKTDNGADYASRAVGAALAALQVDHDLCQPFRPDLKPFIERGLGTMSRDLVELLPGYVGHDVAEREAIRNRVSFARRLMDGRGTPREENTPAEAPELTPAEFQGFLDRWCSHLYAHDPHGGLNKKSPTQQAASCRAPRRRVENAEALAILLSELPSNDGWRIVQKKGISVEGRFYIAPELGAWIGRRVRLRMDDADAGRVWVFDPDETFLCIAEAPELTGVDRAALAAATKAVQRQHLREGRARLRAAEKAAQVDDIAQEILALAEKEHGNIVALEGRGTGYRTEALNAAAEAAAAGPRQGTAPDLTDEEKAAADALFEELERGGKPASAELHSLDGRPFFATDEDFLRWVLAHPDQVTAEDRSYAEELLKRPAMRLLLDLDDEARAAG